MKKLLISLIAVMLLCGMASAQVTLDQHNHYVWFDSLGYLVGQTTDTSSNIYLGYYTGAIGYTLTDESSSQDSSAITQYFDVRMVAGTTAVYWYCIDSLICDSVVANLPTLNYKNISATFTDGLYGRIRTVNKCGTNDSSFVATRIKFSENAKE